MALEDQPIEEVLDELIPEWREITRRMADEGSTDLAIVTELRSRMSAQLDGLLDQLNELKGGEDGGV